MYRQFYFSRYDSTLRDACAELAQRWTSAQDDLTAFSLSDIKAFTPDQHIQLMQELLNQASSVNRYGSGVCGCCTHTHLQYNIMNLTSYKNSLIYRKPSLKLRFENWMMSIDYQKYETPKSDSGILYQFSVLLKLFTITHQSTVLTKLE